MAKPDPVRLDIDTSDYTRFGKVFRSSMAFDLFSLPVWVFVLFFLFVLVHALWLGFTERNAVVIPARLVPDVLKGKEHSEEHARRFMLS